MQCASVYKTRNIVGEEFYILVCVCVCVREEFGAPTRTFLTGGRAVTTNNTRNDDGLMVSELIYLHNLFTDFFEGNYNKKIPIIE